MEARIPNFEDDGPSSNATTDGIVAGGSSRVPVDGVPGLRAGAQNGGGLLGLAWLSSPDQDMQAASDSSFKYCPPTPARIMRGNRNNIGSLDGGWGPQHPVTAAGAAVDPAQWGGKAALRPYLDQISGVLADGIPLFQGVSEVVGGNAETIKGKTYDAAHVRDGIKAAYPGQLLLEIPNQNDMGTKMVVLRVPRDLNCPRP